MLGRRVKVSFCGNSADKLRHPRSVAYSVELVVLNKRQIWGGGALHCYIVTINLVIINFSVTYCMTAIFLSS